MNTTLVHGLADGAIIGVLLARMSHLWNRGERLRPLACIMAAAAVLLNALATEGKGRPASPAMFWIVIGLCIGAPAVGYLGMRRSRARTAPASET